MKEKCSLCGAVLPYYSLRRCWRCGKLYCQNCITFVWNRNVLREVPVCLNCARRYVSPRTIRKSKYAPLSTYLARRRPYSKYVTLNFAKIHRIIGDKLPFSAFQDQQWWSNSQNKVWVQAGWNVYKVDLENQTVIFERTGSYKRKRKPNKLRKGAPGWEKKVSPARPQRKRTPSKTKIAKAYARLKNVERKRASPRQYRGRLKPRSAYQKRLYKSEAKPD